MTFETLEQLLTRMMLGAEPEDTSVSAAASHFMSSEDHPSALASGFNEIQCNTDFDWLTSWGAVRRYICEYLDALTRRQHQILVHVVAQRRGTTTACGAYCPNALLDSQVAMSHFTDWCEEYTFPFDQAYTRAFPVSVELYQNLPAIVVVQHLEDGILPLVVEVITDAHRIHLVMMAQSHEFVSEIMDWTHTQTEVRLPYVLTYQDQRATYWQRLSIVAGAVLRVRCVTDAELDNPVQSTVETGPSLEYYSHATWSSLHTNPEPEHPCEECQETEEHTLLQASVLVQNIVVVSSTYNAPPEIGETDYPRERAIFEDVDAMDELCLFQFQEGPKTRHWYRRPFQLEPEDTVEQERDRFLEWRRKVELTRRTTTRWNFPQVYAEATWYLAARSYWPDFVFYTTRDQKVVHWGLAVDEFFVLEQQFSTVIRDFVSQRISMEIKTQLLQVVPLPDIHEQDGEDDIYIYIFSLMSYLCSPKFL